MHSTDPIADMITILRNGILRKKNYIVIQSSNMRKEIARILEGEKYINKYSILKPSPEENRKFEEIKINIRYLKNGKSFIQGMERISRPGKRVYVNSKNIPVVLNHIGIAILSTNKGLITDSKARKEKVGGEYICKIW